ncbi:MAG: aminoacyl-tRNA hydrolase [Thermoanaerobaculaceae bacterium]|nr:aminoacyl-tRNA hydrolase [Thermoanaerobaculaceae bacterium]
MQVSKIVVGLGNPGEEYQRTPHNAGFEIVLKLAEDLKAGRFKKHKESLIATINIKGEGVILALPQTFMNNSGIAVRSLLSDYKLEPSNIIVCYDDLDLPFASIKLRLSGGAGGHHGMESIISELGEKTFPRIRFGVKKEGIEKENIIDYLLSKIEEKDYEKFLEGVNTGAAALKDALFRGFNYAMNYYNKKNKEDCDNQKK